MRNIINMCRGYWEEAADPSGENGGGAPAAGGSAFAQKAGEQETQVEGKPAGESPETNEGGQAEQNPNGQENGSAFSRKMGEQPAAANEPKEPTREELASMTDEDWAKGVLPEDKDADGNEIDRTFMTAMAKTCREAGISPKQMRTMSDRFQELAKAEMATREARAAEEAKALNEANAAATKAAVEKFDDRQWGDIRAAGAKYIPAGSELAKLMEGPLGSNIELLSILNVVGKSLRSAATDTTAAGGTGENDPALAVVRKTCGVAFGNK